MVYISYIILIYPIFSPVFRSETVLYEILKRASRKTFEPGRTYHKTAVSVTVDILCQQFIHFRFQFFRQNII